MNSTVLSLMTLLILTAAPAQSAEIRYTGMSGRDPFAAPVDRKTGEDPSAAEKKLRSFVIQGIVASADNPRALINGKIYRVGSELLPGAKITRIVKAGVFVMSGDKEILLGRSTPSIKGKVTS